jgi:hypothetical protein
VCLVHVSSSDRCSHSRQGNGSRPCAKCQRDGVQCTFVGRQARRGPKRNSENHELKQRMELLEQQLLSMVQEMPNATVEVQRPLPSGNLAPSTTTHSTHAQRLGSLPIPPPWSSSEGQTAALGPNIPEFQSPLVAGSPSFSASGSSWVTTSGLQTNPSGQSLGSLSSEIARPYSSSNASQTWPQRLERDVTIVPSSQAGYTSAPNDIGPNFSTSPEKQQASIDVDDVSKHRSSENSRAVLQTG